MVEQDRFHAVESILSHRSFKQVGFRLKRTITMRFQFQIQKQEIELKHPSIGGRVEVGRASGNRGWEDSTERERASLSLVSHRSLTCKGLAIKRSCSHFKSSHIIHTGHQLSFGDDKDKDKRKLSRRKFYRWRRSLLRSQGRQGRGSGRRPMRRPNACRRLICICLVPARKRKKFKTDFTILISLLGICLFVFPFFVFLTQSPMQWCFIVILTVIFCHYQLYLKHSNTHTHTQSCSELSGSF